MNLWEMSLSGVVMIIAIIAIRRVAINKLPKRVFILLWEAVLLRLLIPFSIPSVLSAYSFVRNNIPTQKSLVESPAGNMVSQVVVGQIDINTGAVEVLQNDKLGLSIWFVLWIAGALLCTVIFAITYLKCYLEFKTSMPVRNEFVINWLGKHRLKRSIQIRQSDKISAPLTYGIINPVILMPKKTDWENSQQLQYVLLHEYVHICRFDMAIKLIATFALCVHWFNPFVWWMYVLFNRDIELLCDAIVVQQFGEDSKSAYARTLISMEEKKSGLTPLCNNFSKNAIEERITAIMKTKKITIGALIFSVVIVITVVVLFATSAEKQMPLNNVDKTVIAEGSESQDEVMGVEKLPVGQKSTDELKQQIGVESGNGERENSTNANVRGKTMIIQCMLEGMLEEMPATLYVGDGFSIYIPDKGWQIYDKTLEAPVLMTAVGSSDISIWVEHYEEKPSEVEAHLFSEGYIYDVDGKKLQKSDGTLLMEARIAGWENDTWAVCSMHPSTSEGYEGAGARLDAIAGTFAITVNQEENLLGMEQAELKNIMTTFYEAFFAGDTNGIKMYLSDSFDSDVEVYDNPELAEQIEIREIKGMDYVTDNMDDTCTLSLEFVVPEEDSYTYLTVTFIRENGGWRISSYGLEK